MRKILPISLLLASSATLGGNVLGIGYVLGNNNPNNFDDPDVNRLLDNAAHDCYRSGSCSSYRNDEFEIRNEETNTRATWVWTGWGWRGPDGSVYSVRCGPLDGGDDLPIGDSDPF